MKEEMTDEEKKILEEVKGRFPDIEYKNELVNLIRTCWSDKEVSLDERISIIDFVKKNGIDPKIAIDIEKEILDGVYLSSIVGAARKDVDPDVHKKTLENGAKGRVDEYKRMFRGKEDLFLEIFRHIYGKKGFETLQDCLAYKSIAKDLGVSEFEVFMKRWNAALQVYYDQNNAVKEVKN